MLSGNAHHLPPEAPGGNAVAVGPGGAVAAAAAAEQQHPLRLYWEYLSFLFRCAGVWCSGPRATVTAGRCCTQLVLVHTEQPRPLMSACRCLPSSVIPPALRCHPTCPALHRPSSCTGSCRPAASRSWWRWATATTCRWEGPATALSPLAQCARHYAKRRRATQPVAVAAYNHIPSLPAPSLPCPAVAAAAAARQPGEPDVRDL